MRGVLSHFGCCRRYTFFIPPNFPEDLSTPAPGNVLARIPMLKMQLELQAFADRGAVEELVDRTKYAHTPFLPPPASRADTPAGRCVTFYAPTGVPFHPPSS